METMRWTLTAVLASVLLTSGVGCASTQPQPPGSGPPDPVAVEAERQKKAERDCMLAQTGFSLARTGAILVLRDTKKQATRDAVNTSLAAAGGAVDGYCAAVMKGDDPDAAAIALQALQRAMDELARSTASG